MSIESFEATQKINALAKELLKHRVVSTAEEAFKQAEATVRGNSSEQPFIAKGPAPAGQAQQDDTATALDRDVRQLKFALSDLAKVVGKLNEDMSTFGVEIANIKTDLSMVRGDVNLLKQKLRGAQITQNDAASQQEQAPPAPQTPQEQASAHLNRIIRPREPEQKPVDINKIFYFGKK